MSTILVHLSRPDAAPACLAAAADAARALPAARIVVLHVRIDPATTILPSEEVLTEDHRQALERQATADRAALHAAFLAWQPGAPPSSWQDATGRPAEQVLQHSRAAALVVATLPGPHPPHREHAAFDAVLFDCRRPLLAVPADWTGRFGRHLAVGWRDTPGTRHAIDAAAPWLQAAQAITAIEITDHPGPPPPLPRPDWPGVFARRTVAPASRNDGAALLTAAIDAGADSLVLGAYRRGRLLEWVLGGVTEHVLRHATLPLLLKH